MIAKLVSLRLKDGVSPEVAEKMADAFVQHSQDISGIIAVHFFGDRNDNRYGSLTIWESDEAAEKGYQTISARLGTNGHEFMDWHEENIFDYYTPRNQG